MIKYAEFANFFSHGRKNPAALTNKKQESLTKYNIRRYPSWRGVQITVSPRNIKIILNKEHLIKVKGCHAPHLYTPRSTHACQQKYNPSHDLAPFSEKYWRFRQQKNNFFLNRTLLYAWNVLHRRRASTTNTSKVVFLYWTGAFFFYSCNAAISEGECIYRDKKGEQIVYLCLCQLTWKAMTTSQWFYTYSIVLQQQEGMGGGGVGPTPHRVCTHANSYLSYIYLGYFVCLCVIVCVCHICGTHCYSFSFGNQTDKGDETEGLEREG
jgi:hypothetical protein